MVQPCNLFIYTKIMQDQLINKMVGKKYLKFMSIKDLELDKTKSQYSLKQIAQKINELGLGPTLYEIGQTTLFKSFK